MGRLKIGGGVIPIRRKKSNLRLAQIGELRKQKKVWVRLRNSHPNYKPTSGTKEGYNINTLHMDPSEHISSKVGDYDIKGCTNLQMIRYWYEEAQPLVKDIVNACGFSSILQSEMKEELDRPLIRVLAEHWWDETHTFHFKGVGEFTVTPKDFSAITGIAVSGMPLCLRRVSTNQLQNLLGDPILDFDSDDVDVYCLYSRYKSVICSDVCTAEQIARAFILCFLGCTLFANERRKVNLKITRALIRLDVVNHFNWGGAALAYLFQSLDAISRRQTHTAIGLAYIIPIWVHEYFPSIMLNQITIKEKRLPRLLSTFNVSTSEEAKNFGEIYYSLLFKSLQLAQVQKEPWLDECIPAYVAASIHLSRRRVLLVSPEGGAWYLAERVTKQSLQHDTFFRPMPPPRSMSNHNKRILVDKRWITYGRLATRFIIHNSAEGHDDGNNISRANVNVQDHHIITPSAEGFTESTEVFPIPPWTLLIPSAEGRPQLIRIPTDVDIDNYSLPKNVEQVSIGTATTLLRMIAGMQYVLINNVLNTRDSLRDYVTTIQRLEYQLSDYENAAAYLNEDGNENSDTNEGPTVDSATEDCGGVD